MTPVKRKIVWLAHEANISGANIALLEYITALKAAYDFHVILPHEGSMQGTLLQQGIPSSVIYQYGWANSIPWWNIRQWIRLGLRTKLAVVATTSLIKKEAADLVFTNTIIPFTAAKAAWHLHIPHVWWIHEFGEEDFGFTIGWGNPKRAFGKIKKWSRLIICNSWAVVNKFSKHMPGADIRYLYQPVSWHPHAVMSGAKQAKYLMFGQISRSKGHLEVLEAIAVIKNRKLPPISLHIKGPSDDKFYLESLLHFISKHELADQVQVSTGYFIKEEVMPFYDVLIVASASEAFGRVIVEAQKAGLKVIVKNSGGAPELLNANNGLLYNSLAELVAILAAEKKMPEGPATLSYNEADEIDKLKNILSALT